MEMGDDEIAFEEDQHPLLPGNKRKSRTCSDLSITIDNTIYPIPKHHTCSQRYAYTYKHYTHSACSLYRLHYRCFRRCAGSGCAATFQVTFDPTNNAFLNESHGARRHSCGTAPSDDRVVSDFTLIQEMQTRALSMLRSNPNIPPRQMARKVISDCNALPGLGNQTTLSVNDLQKFIHNSKKSSSIDWLMRIQTPPLCLVSDSDSRHFLQFCLRCVVKNKSSSIIGWAHPIFMALAKSGELHYLIDGTFKGIPKGFKQLIGLLCFDPRTRLYLPMFYILAQSKDQEVYVNALYLIQQATGFNIRPKSFTADFEAGIYNSVKLHFPDTTIVGCLFHFVQALKRRLKKVHRLADSIVDVLVGENRGLLKLLCVVSAHEIESKTIPYIKEKLSECVDTSGIICLFC